MVASFAAVIVDHLNRKILNISRMDITTHITAT